MATMNLSGNVDNTVSYTDNQRNDGRNWQLQPAVIFGVNIPDALETDINLSYNFGNAVTKYPDRLIATKTEVFIISLNGKCYISKNLTFGYDYVQTRNYGYSVVSTSGINILNLYLGYSFLKNNSATIAIQGFDLFNQNTGVSRIVNGNTITDSQYQRLLRYFLISFNLKLSKFANTISK
jgi:hypothetical protein